MSTPNVLSDAQREAVEAKCLLRVMGWNALDKRHMFKEWWIFNDKYIVMPIAHDGPAFLIGHTNGTETKHYRGQEKPIDGVPAEWAVRFLAYIEENGL
jgi:hypothetical protein